MRDRLVKLLATGFHSSAVPPWPGTSGTVPAWLLVYFVVRGDMLWLALLAVAGFFVSVWVSAAAEGLMGHDSRYIVIDEWAGMFVAVLFVPWTLGNYLLAFVAFRLFDAIKVPPAGRVEELPRGWGVTMDDIVAGLQANLLVQAWVWLQRWLT